MTKLTYPFDEKAVRALKAGEAVSISGRIYTGRDKFHKFFADGGKLGPGRYDVTTKCSCPDYANPCKHSAAVLLLLGEEIARRPLTLLELRGILPEELCDED